MHAQEGRAKLAEKLGKWKLEDVHRVMDLMDLARGSGSKVLQRITMFPSDAHLPCQKPLGYWLLLTSLGGMAM